VATIQNLTKRQLTLFVQDNNGTIEKIRREFNPVQWELIQAHVTLCREDEIEEIEVVVQNIRSLRIDNPLKITFDLVDRFQDGKGVLIPAKVANYKFDDLRKKVLKGINDSPRQHRPHITLMHPRNSTCIDNIFNQIKQCKLPMELSFDKISLIEQKNGGRWTVMEEFQIVTQ